MHSQIVTLIHLSFHGIVLSDCFCVFFPFLRLYFLPLHLDKFLCLLSVYTVIYQNISSFVHFRWISVSWFLLLFIDRFMNLSISLFVYLHFFVFVNLVLLSAALYWHICEFENLCICLFAYLYSFVFVLLLYIDRLPANQTCLCCSQYLCSSLDTIVQYKRKRWREKV